MWAPGALQVLCSGGILGEIWGVGPNQGVTEVTTSLGVVLDGDCRVWPHLWFSQERFLWFCSHSGIFVIKCGQKFRFPPKKKKKEKRIHAGEHLQCRSTQDLPAGSARVCAVSALEIITCENMWFIIADVYGSLKTPYNYIESREI